MFVDSRELSPRNVLETDVCVVGAGAAGITIARAFAGTSTQVTVLESGGFAYDELTQSLYKGRNTGLRTFPLHVNRLRYFGGTTNHWAGHCRPLDAIDLERKQWMPYSGWPLSRAELDPYYIEAQPVLGLGEYQYENLQRLEDGTGLSALPLDRRRLKTAVYGQSPPTRFGEVYRDELEEAGNVRVYLHANALELLPDDALSRVNSLSVACIDGPRFSVQARFVILAAGGIENARILLLSDSRAPGGLGNGRNIVGRFFMDHVLLRPGLDVSLTGSGTDFRLYQELHRLAGGKTFAVVTAAEELLRQERMTNFRIHLVPAGPKYGISMGSVFSALDGHPESGTLKKRRDNSVAMHLVLEPVPNPDSRVSLSDERDLLGQRRLQVNWQLTPTELTNAHRALELLAVEFGRMGLGRAYGTILADKTRWPGNLEAGKHHCGTTRMSDNPATGVVDVNCRVFGFDNLYVAGSSVFPTIGYANPTLTIVALALRLAEHLKGLT